MGVQASLACFSYLWAFLLMAIATLGLALLAGLFSTLSPCVLPILPIVVGTAAAQHRMGPLALAGGLAASFVAIGLFVATAGFAIGLDTAVFRQISALVMIGVGVLLVSSRLQQATAGAVAPLANWADNAFSSRMRNGAWGQAGVGLLLGAVWSPCVGPTLGAASVLAAQGKDLGQVALTMLVFGIGAALPLLLLGVLSREAMLRIRGRLAMAGSAGKSMLGAVLVAIGFLVLSGFDKVAEAALVDVMPAWLTELTTRF